LNLMGPLANWIQSSIPLEPKAQVVGDEFFVTRSILSSQLNGGQK
jgi:hypothetical protein